MGVITNSPVFISDKDSTKPNNEEFGVRAIKFHNEEQDSSSKTSISEGNKKLSDSVQLECEQDQENKPRRSLIKSFNIIVAESNNGDGDDDEDGFKTPTSFDHKIPPMLECPGAPRKKVTKPAKRKAAACCRRLVFDLSKEVESMFATSFVEDLHGNNKKLKNCSILRD